jgi:hypothetical protein
MALNWNVNALEFYRGLGAKVMDEWVLLRLKRAQLQELGAKATETS